MSLKTLLFAVTGLIAMGAVGVLTRLAFDDVLIDPVSFTQIRLFSGTLVLLPFLNLGRSSWQGWRRNWRPALALFITFLGSSFGYFFIDACMGALILFAMVQITMIGTGMIGGERPNTMEWAGLVLAFVGLVYFVSPGLSAPPIPGTMLMVVTGMAWGMYSVYGRGESDPVGASTRNFLLTLPLNALLLVGLPIERHVEMTGVGLAVLTGAAASGLGSLAWYMAVGKLTPMLAPLVQLAVPLLTDTGGVLLLGEPFTPRLMYATALILGGIALAIIAEFRRPAPTHPSG